MRKTEKSGIGRQQLCQGCSEQIQIADTLMALSPELFTRMGRLLFKLVSRAKVLTQSTGMTGSTKEPVLQAPSFQVDFGNSCRQVPECPRKVLRATTDVDRWVT